MGGCSLYEKGVYQTLVFDLRNFANLEKLSKDKTTVNVHGWYIISSRGLSYLYMTFHKVVLYTYAWASALSVSTVGQCEGLEGGMGNRQDSHAFFLFRLEQYF